MFWTQNIFYFIYFILMILNFNATISSSGSVIKINIFLFFKIFGCTESSLLCKLFSSCGE